MNIKCILVILLNSIGGIVCAQTLQNVIGPSPNAAAFDKYGNIPVSTYTGVPDITIPIYKIKNKTLEVPITISYHAGGIQVDEEASRLGLGWVLNSGGVINRQINGIDDFYAQYGYLNNNASELYSTAVTEGLKVEPNITGPLFEGGHPVDCQREIVGSSIDFTGFLFTSDLLPTQEENFYDLEPDIFSYDFLNYTGKFIIRKNKQIVKERPDNLDIKLVNNDGSAFKITTPEGNQYIFDKTEYCSFSVPPANLSYITTWYLTKIIAPTNEEIDFHYSVKSNVSVTPFFNLQQKQILFCQLDQSDQDNTSCPALTGQLTSSLPPSKSYPLVLLDSITYSYGAVRFQYASRIDLQGDEALTNIHVINYSNQTYNQSIQFLQNYFTSNAPDIRFYDDLGTTFQNNATKRLKLSGLIKSDEAGLHKKQYNFTYNEGSLPPKNSYSRDKWGFYNGAVNYTLLPTTNYIHNEVGSSAHLTFTGANRNPNANYSQAFILKEIQYPTGGKTDFDYEQNDYDIKNSTNIYSPANNPELLTSTQNFQAERGADATFNLSIPSVNSQATLFTTSTNGGAVPSNTPPPQDGYISFYSQGSSTATATVQLQFAASWTTHGTGTYQRTDALILPAGNYTVVVHVANSVTFLQYLNFRLSWYYYKDLTSHAIEQGGGLRILRMTDKDALTNNLTIKKYLYHYNQDYNNDGVPEECSYGKRLANVIYTGNEYMRSSYLDGEGNIVYSYCDTYDLFSDSHVQALSPIVGYDKVTALNGENGEGGKTEFFYENQPDFQVSYNFTSGGSFYGSSGPLGDLRPEGIPNLLDVSNGQLLHQIDFKNSSSVFIPQKEIINDYNNQNPQSASTLLGVRRLVLLPGGVSFGFDCGWLLASYPAFQSLWAPLLSQTVNEFDPTGTSYLQTVFTYNYETNPIHYQPIKIATQRSDGRKQYNYISYPSDYAPGTTFTDYMITKRIFKPIENVNVIEDFAGNKIITAGSITKYRIDNPALIDNVSTLKTIQPLQLNNFKFSNQNVGSLPGVGSNTIFSQDANYQPLYYFDRYDVNNNLLEQHKVSDIHTSYLWDYLNIYPIAQVTNAASDQIAYTSFEADGKGGWSYAGSAVQDATSPTGNYCFNPGNHTVTTPLLNSGTDYIISYWIKGTTPLTTVPKNLNTGGTPIQGKKINNWTYFEHHFNGTTGFSITDAARIDELRLYPVGSQMTTYTYAPMIGMTSQCDVNNRITYYEYDALGRLDIVRDQDQNILKKYCYNYAGQQTDCGVSLFYSKAYTAYVVKNNCTAGKTGTVVPYTDEAGMFTSAMNQADADGKAVTDANNHAQSIANQNGSCITTANYTATYSNGTSATGFTGVYTNLFTGNQYTVSAGVPTISTLPAGSYNVKISSTGNTSSYQFVLSIGGSANQLVTSGASANFYNVVINANTGIGIHNLDTIFHF